MNSVQTESKILYPKLSYILIGLCFEVHNLLGRFSREKQYCDQLEKKLIENQISYKREHHIGDSGNNVDFVIENKIVLELKAIPIIGKKEYYQVQRYLQSSQLKLGILVNFNSFYLRPKRLIRIDTGNKNRFI